MESRDKFCLYRMDAQRVRVMTARIVHARIQTQIAALVHIPLLRRYQVVHMA